MIFQPYNLTYKTARINLYGMEKTLMTSKFYICEQIPRTPEGFSEICIDILWYFSAYLILSHDVFPSYLAGVDYTQVPRKLLKKLMSMVYMSKESCIIPILVYVWAVAFFWVKPATVNVLICGSEHRTVSCFFFLGGSLHSDPGRWCSPSSKPPGNTAEKHRRPLAKLWTGLELLLASWSGQKGPFFLGSRSSPLGSGLGIQNLLSPSRGLSAMAQVKGNIPRFWATPKEKVG